MRDDDLPESGNIEDRRGEGGFSGGPGGGFPIGRGGGLSIGTVVVLGLIGWALGIDPSLLIGGAEVFNRQTPTTTTTPTTPRQTGAPSDDSGRFVSRVLGSTEVVWKDIFTKDGKTYRAPTLVLFNGSTQANCGGVAQSAMGPFYCPNDKKIYLDTSFFEQIERRFQGCEGRACRFSYAYVIAHEVGHHVQNEIGTLTRANSMHADMFLSIHHDGARDEYLKPWQFEGKALFYFDEPTGFSLHVSPRFPESLDLARTLADQLAARGLRFTTFHAPDSPAGAQVPFLDASRGIYRRDHLFVLNRTDMPALLFEAGFIINRDEELILSSPGHQEKIASAMTDAVRKFCSADR